MAQRIFSPSAARLAGNVATVGFLVVIVLQFLLAVGVVPITMAWGGSQSVLTPALSMASLAAAVLLGVFAYVIRRRAGLSARARPSRLVQILAWVITGFLAVDTLGVLTSPSRGEVILFGPLVLALTLACVLVSASGNDG